EKPSIVLRRLARDPGPDERAAVNWLATRLVDAAPDTKLLEAAARALMAATEPVEAVDEDAMIGPDLNIPSPVPDHELLPVRFLSRGVDAGRSVVLVRAQRGDAPKSQGTGWLLSPSLVVVPAHLFWFHLPERERDWRLLDETMAIEVLFGFDEAA